MIPEIERKMSASMLEGHQEFLVQYREMRRAEGRGSDDASYYLRLPDGDFSGQRASEWQMRRESLEWVLDFIREEFPHESLRILDAGAGNCWLTRYLAEAGHKPVALDLNDDPYDGLEAGRHYLESLPITFRRVLSDFIDVPFPDGSFELVIFNGAIHYGPDLRRVLAESRRILRPGGAVLIIDTPFYHDSESGERMLAERSDPGRAGFLTYDGLSSISAELGMQCSFRHRPTTLLNRLKKRLGDLRRGRETASMPWVVLHSD